MEALSSQQPHKNLAYIQSARRLNSHQAWWAMFFSRFNFTLTYRPGSRNVKPDALSRQNSPEEAADTPEANLPPGCVVASLTWGIEKTVRDAQQQQQDPGTGPANHLFVPDSVCPQVLQWAHTSKFTLVLTAPCLFLRDTFGGPVWGRTPRSMSQLAPPAPVAKRLIKLQPNYFILYPSPTGPGPILP